MGERILNLAAAAAGAGSGERVLLEPLCAAAEAAWRARVSDDAGDCSDALACAAAFTAAANLLAGGGEGVSSFSAGDVSVHLSGAAGRAQTAQALLQAAERLMAPYARTVNLWAKGVRG